MTAESPKNRRDLFDGSLLARNRDRSTRLGFAGGGDFLHREIAAITNARLSEVNREFADVAIVGSGGGVHQHLLQQPCRSVTEVEISHARASTSAARSMETLPFQPGKLDLCLSMLEMHWINDPVGHLIQMRRALRPDGLMIAAFFGGQTLQELRTALAEAEIETTGGLSPRVAPMAEIREAGALLQRAGFALPVADVERIVVSYASPVHLMRELRAMGETNVMHERRKVFLRRDTLMRMKEVYFEKFADAEGRVQATFEIVFLTGWAPAATQPKPLRPGSANQRLADALGTEETSVGEVAMPPRKSGANELD